MNKEIFIILSLAVIIAMAATAFPLHIEQNSPDNAIIRIGTGTGAYYLTIGSSVSAADADYTCDGANDDVQFQAALDALTDIRVYPISCSFGLLRPGDIQSTDYAFTLYNASNVTASVTIAVAGDWHGVTNWTHSDTCTPGVNTAGLIAKVEDDNGSHTEVIVKKVEPYNYLANNLTPGSTIDFALEIHAPTQFTDYSPKKNTIYITVSEA